jgi:hypothetical protein
MFAKITDINCTNIGIETINSEIPTEFSLKQNYPNPFNPVTQIEFSLQVESRISLKIYNSLGELVAVAAEGYYKAGNYRADFDASNLASGVYFYLLEYSANNGNKKGSITKKMVSLK